MFILQAADSFTMIHYLEYYSTHTSGHCGGGAVCLHHRRRAALPHHAARLLPLYLHFAQAATTIYILASAPLSGAAVGAARALPKRIAVTN